MSPRGTKIIREVLVVPYIIKPRTEFWDIMPPFRLIPAEFLRTSVALWSYRTEEKPQLLSHYEMMKMTAQ